MKNLLILITILLAGVSCRPLQYQFYNPKLSTTDDYRTFVVVNNCEEGQEIISDNQQRQVAVAFASRFYEKGLKPEENQIADLIVSYYVKSNTYEVEEVCFDNYEDYLLGPLCKAKVTTYQINALVIDFFDTERNSIVFHSAIEGLDFKKPAMFTKELEKAVDKIITKFDNNRTIIASL